MLSKQTYSLNPLISHAFNRSIYSTTNLLTTLQPSTRIHSARLLNNHYVHSRQLLQSWHARPYLPSDDSSGLQPCQPPCPIYLHKLKHQSRPENLQHTRRSTLITNNNPTHSTRQQTARMHGFTCFTYFLKQATASFCDDVSLISK